MNTKTKRNHPHKKKRKYRSEDEVQYGRRKGVPWQKRDGEK
jgi:hypothetical protein